MTCHASLVCQPSRVAHGRIPYNILDHKLGYNPNPRLTTSKNVADEIQRTTGFLNDKTKRNIMQSYLKYKAYYERIANDNP